MNISEKFIYANNNANNTDDATSIPAEMLCGIESTNTGNVICYFKSAVESDTTDVFLVRESSSDPRPVMEAIVNEINYSKKNKIVLGDDFSKQYIHPSITSVSLDLSASSNITFTTKLTVINDVVLGTAPNADSITVNGLLKRGNVVETDKDTQNATITGAEFRKGVIVHTSQTGAGVVTFDTATNLISELDLVSDNEAVTCLYINDGNQNVTLNGGTPAGVTYVNNPTIAAESAATLVVRRTGASAVSVYIV